jgi:glycerophosphoryl diester phosphodiesterase
VNHLPFFALEHPIATAHRGGAGLWPENTLLAFQGAVGLGFRYLETDLHTTRDGVLVCLHDHLLERTTDGRGPVWEHDWETVARLDAAHHFRPDEGYPWRDRRAGVPRLDEVVRELPESYFTLELKQDGTEGPVAELIGDLDLWDRVLVGSFSDRRLRRFRRLTGGRVATSAGERDSARVWAASRSGLPFPSRADALQLPQYRRGVRVVDARLLSAAHRAGKQVHVWTIDDPDTMHELLDLGVDGIITDRPDILRQVLAQR